MPTILIVRKLPEIELNIFPYLLNISRDIKYIPICLNFKHVLFFSCCMGTMRIGSYSVKVLSHSTVSAALMEIPGVSLFAMKKLSFLKIFA